MLSLRRITLAAKHFNALPSTVKPNLNLTSAGELPATTRRWSSRSSRSGEEEWNEAWESAWLPQNLTPKTRAPWENDVNFTSTANTEADAVDAETKAFVEEMNENWNERRKGLKKEKEKEKEKVEESSGKLYSLENIKKDYRLKKQKLHAGLWRKEIEKLEEAKLGGGDDVVTGDDDIQRLLDSCSEYASFELLLFS